MGWPQKEYLTRRGVARRRAYPSIFIRRRLHGYISRNVTITNAGTPSAVETSSCFWGSGAARALRGANPRATSASFRPTPLPVSDIPATTAKNKTRRGIRSPHMRLACFARWIHFGRDIPLSPRRYRPSVKRFARSINHESAIYGKRERFVCAPAPFFFFSLSFRSTCIFSSRLKYMKKYFSTGSVAMEKKRRIRDIYGYSIRFSFDANAEREREREGRSRVEME